MSVRIFIEQQKRWLAPALIVGIGYCGYAAWTSARNAELPDSIEQVYFSDDDGKTYFADAAENWYSFDRGGKSAFRAFVYQCGSGKPFVGLLVRTVSQPGTGAAAAVDPRYKGQKGPPPPIELRKPGQSDWVLATSPEGLALVNSLCPEANSAESVLP